MAANGSLPNGGLPPQRTISAPGALSSQPAAPSNAWEESVRQYINAPVPQTEADRLEASLVHIDQEFNRLRNSVMEQRHKLWASQDECARLRRQFERGKILTGALTAEREYLEKHGMLPPPALPATPPPRNVPEPRTS